MAPKAEKRCLIASATNGRDVDIILPGSEIPEWFSHQTDGCSINIHLPHHLWNDSRFIGVAFCFLFDHAVTIRCNHIGHGYGLPFEDRSLITKDHLWLHYWSRDYLLHSSSSKYGKCGETEHLFSLEPDVLQVWVDRGVNKKCGVRIVYEQDLEEMEQIIKGHQIPQIDITPFDEKETGKRAGLLELLTL
ncbi:TMV resistance protein N-like protein [Corchorus olitorius]|uniref:TMV resistance protein N-like protein n=1 Tax=Corchorus olitorius TaxID=93759 RepID=A0A1R3JCY6_9ROSI|nr:TMV resistance protein N-like protein [Corchorus olitorius]